MKVLKAILNGFGIFFAVIFSIVLTLALIATPVVSVASSFLETETLHTVVKEIDYAEILVSNEEVADTLEENGLDAETITSIVESEAVEKTMDLYMEDFFAALEGEVEEKNLTPEAIKAIAYEHMDEIVEIAKEYKDPANTVTEAEIQDQISTVVEEYADEVVELFPEPEALGLTEDTVSPEQQVVVSTVKYLRNGAAMWGMVLVVVILSVLILVCRLKNFQGFLWLGIVFSLAAFFAFVVSLVMGSSGLMNFIPAEEGFTIQLADSLFTVFASGMLTRGILLIVLGLVFTAVYVVGKILLAKKKEAVQSPI